MIVVDDQKEAKKRKSTKVQPIQDKIHTKEGLDHEIES